MVDRQGICEQEDWAPKELRGDVGSAKLARHEANMCRAPLCSSMLSQDYLRSVREWKDGGVGGQERQWCEIVWALRQPEEMEVGFCGDMGDPV